MPISNPVIPAQPNEARYGVERLFTSPRLTRAVYQEIYGEQAPAYDPKRQIKRWFFTDVIEGSTDPANELCEIQVWDSAKQAIRKMAMTKKEAASVNLPGAIVWPKYVNPVATLAVVVGPDGDRLQISGETLVDLTLAKSVVNEINSQCGAAFTLAAAGDPWPWKIVWGMEPRRRMNITNGNVEFDAAALLRNRFAKGVGSPGQWSLGSDGGPVFVPDVPIDGEQDVRPEVPMPCRSLLSNERFEAVTFGGMGGIVVRTDLTLNEPAPGTGQLTAAQDALLRQIAADTTTLRKTMGA
jgi:hypothetical protein